ncbi:MAG: RNA methyltransferase [Bacillales bacterium]|nr:RNA methyltransferase [Bacillales bacterium]
MAKEITSSSNPLIKELVGLKNSKKKKELNRFLIEGEDLIELAYQNNMLDMIVTSIEISLYPSIEIIKVPEFIMEKLSNNKSTSKMIGVAHYDKKELTNDRRVVYLDGVQDPGNVGTIIRTALAFEYDAVILSGDSASKYNEKVIQSSKGAVFSMKVIDDITIEGLKDRGYQIIVTALKNAIDYKDILLKEQFVLVLGNEGQGVKETNLSLADTVVKIDMKNIDSLNVAIAGGILMNFYR